MSTKRRLTIFAARSLLALAIATGLAKSMLPAYSQAPEPLHHIVIPLNKSATLQMPRPFSTATVGSPEIADALPMTDRSLYIQGKKIGTTNVSIYDENMRLIKVVDVEVGLDTGNLQSKI